MIKIEQPKLYIVSPGEFEIERFSEDLKPLLDSIDISCFRLALSTQEEGTIAKTADCIRNICHSRDVAIVIEDHFLFVQKHGLDGVHLSDGARNVRKARENLGKEAIVGAFCGNSKHNYKHHHFVHYSANIPAQAYFCQSNTWLKGFGGVQSYWEPQRCQNRSSLEE